MIKRYGIWLLFILASITVFLSVYSAPVLNYGGDIAEYHGITETILKSKTIALTLTDEEKLKKILQPSYYNNPGYYMKGLDGKRYPVHFIFYSILALPVRVLLHLFAINELQSLRLTNVVIFISTLFFILKYFAKDSYQRLMFLITCFFSPLLFFLSWPGPDILYLCLLLTAVLLFLKKKYMPSAFLIAFASWQSQPLLLTALLVCTYSLLSFEKQHRKPSKKNLIEVLKVLGVGIILSIPILYNILIFGTWSPWTKLQDGWTIMNGFGIQNMSLQKLFEQFFDLNFGLFFYAPFILLGGIFYIFMNIKKLPVLFLLIIFLTTAFFYQTNPAWHYGTAGFGPNRHAIFLLPLFIIFFVLWAHKSKVFYSFLCVTIFLQLAVLSMNGWTNPFLPNTLDNSPVAKFVLDRWPQFYNPTPEIFVDRTNHTDLDYPTGAVYKHGGICKKAYVLISSQKQLTDACGFIPESYKTLLDDEFSRKSNVKRDVTVTQAVFWPDINSCNSYYNGPFLCMHTLEDFAKNTKIFETMRVRELRDGVWEIKLGTPLRITVPPGYTLEYQGVAGVYVNY